jgi:hypothetical protein
VNGASVRDRDQRLHRLFLDPSAEARAQLARIKEDSARYNIGEVERNVNVPLFPLLFLHPGNTHRFAFELGKRRQRDGRPVRELRYEERERPTIVRGMRASGWFLIDAEGDAIVESVTMRGRR